MKQQAHTAVVVAYGRSPVCKAGKGALSGIHPLDFGAQVLRGVLDKVPQLDPAQIDDVVIGCAIPENELSYNPARCMVLRAGLPDSVSAQTINRFCSSSLQAVATCANAILAGQADVMIAGGVEYMSSKGTAAEPEWQNQWLKDNHPDIYLPMGITAENVVKRYGITRAEMDRMAVESNAKAWKAQQEGWLNQAIIPLKFTDPNGQEITVTQDEGIRPGTSMEGLAGLRPAFLPDGTVTAATSSQRSDGASFAILMSAEKAEELGIRPLARFVSFASAGCDPAYMGLGPIYAVPKALEKAGLTMDDMDVIELNEAFAAQAIPCIRELHMPGEKVNPWGGAMALGHPMGATGIFLMSKALDWMNTNGGRYGMVTMCIGGGQGAAAIFEHL